MDILQDYDRWEDVDAHTERAILFADGNWGFDNSFVSSIHEIKDKHDSDTLTIWGYPTGFERLETDNKRVYVNSAWVIECKMLLKDSDEVDPPVDLLRNKLRAKELFPDETFVIVFKNPNNDFDCDTDLLKDEYGIEETDVYDNYSVLLAVLEYYFTHQADPSFSENAQFHIYKWVKKIRDILDE